MGVVPPADILYIQGGASTVAGDANGTYVVIVKDIIPYLHITAGSDGSSKLVNTDILSNITNHLNTALIFSGEDNESSFMVEVSNLSFSDKDKTLKFLIKPLEFYEGDVLKSFVDDKNEFVIDKAGKSKIIGIYLEMNAYTPENGNYPIFIPR